MNRSGIHILYRHPIKTMQQRMKECHTLIQVFGDRQPKRLDVVTVEKIQNLSGRMGESQILDRNILGTADFHYFTGPEWHLAK